MRQFAPAKRPSHGIASPLRAAPAIQSAPAGPTPGGRIDLSTVPLRSGEDMRAAAGQGTSGPARPLPFGAAIQSAFGRHDISGIAAHTDASAAGAAQMLGAEAFATGHRVVFAPNPSLHTAAHEAAHIVQQRSGLQRVDKGGPRDGHETHADAVADRVVRGQSAEALLDLYAPPGHAPAPAAGIVQRKAAAVRFQDEPTLDEISDGKKTLKRKDKGEAVIRVSTALSELGYFTALAKIDEIFGPALEEGVKKFQDAKGLKGKAAAGAVDKPTFDALDAAFSAGYRVERDVLGKQKKPNLTKETQSLDPAEKAASNSAISTEAKPDPVTGKLPEFHPDIPAGNYEIRLQALTDKAIVNQYNRLGKGKAAEHANAAKLVDWPEVDSLAGESAKAVDAVFGEYAHSAAPKHGVNVFDAWDKKEADLKAGGVAKEDSEANWRVFKILMGSDAAMVSLDKEHGAIKSRTDEKKIVVRVQAALVAKYRTELIETDKGWPGFEDDGKTYIQRFQGDTPDSKKKARWKLYQTMIHEYIHGLESKEHVKYRTGMTEQKGNKTLREGTTDYFTKIVWNGIVIDDALRKRIEGSLNDPKTKFPIPPLGTYPEAANAERLAGVVGLRNLAAAFFLGKIDLIGGK